MTPSIASSISSSTSDSRPEIVKHMEIISDIHFTKGDSIELICIPFEFFSLWDDPVNFSNNAGFLDPTRTGSPFKRRLVMKLISLALIVIGLSSQILSLWYQLTRNFDASSLRAPKLSMIGALR